MVEGVDKKIPYFLGELFQKQKVGDFLSKTNRKFVKSYKAQEYNTIC